MIHAAATARGLGFVRAWIFLLWLLHVVPDDPSRLAALPRRAFDAPGLLRIIPESAWDVLLTVPALLALKWILTLGLIACALGVRPWRWIAIPTVLLLTLHQGLARGFFYINHQELSALYAVYVLALFPLSGFSLFKRRDPQPEGMNPTARLAMLLLAVLVLTPYCLIAAHRLTHNDLSFWGSGALPYWIAENSYGPTWYGLTPVAEVVLRQPLLVRALEFGFPIVTTAELLAPFCLVSAKFRRYWLVVMVGFHLSTIVLMDIFFWEVLLLFPVLLLDGEPLLRLLDRVRNRGPGAELLEPGVAVAPEAQPPPGSE
ncbi:MAG: hypothetical protein JKY65_00170 [Planctomycetes bacterium]|nr:hypothetical protein [Planctomycetota bacterium]